MAIVFLPPAMRQLVDGQASIEATGGTVGALLADVEGRYPGIYQRLCENDRLRPGVSVVVNGSVASLGLRQTISADDEIHFLPSIGGG